MNRLRPKQVTGFGHLTADEAPVQPQQEPAPAVPAAPLEPPARPLAAVPAPAAEPEAQTPEVTAAAPAIEPEVPAVPEPEQEAAILPPADSPPTVPQTKAAAKPRAKRSVRVAPTTTADCKNDSRHKHTINVAPDVHRRLLGLQLAETMAAGRERPLWRHIDAALAVLRADEPNAEDLTVWGERAETYGELFGDDYRQIGTLLRASVLTAVRTLRVRLRAAGVADVDAQAVLSAALTVYLDALVAQGDLVEQE